MGDLESILGYTWFILKGARVTVELTVYSSLLALAVAFIAGLGLLSRHLWLRASTRIYVELFRGTSVFVQLFFAFYVLPLFGPSLSPMQAGVLAIGLNGAAYGAEVVRGAISAVGKDQREATVALNLTRWQALWWVILPQAVVMMLPSFGNLAIEMMKATAVASLITVSDLTFQAQIVRNQTGQTAFPFLLILLTYLVIASVMIAFVRWLERRSRRGMAEIRQ